MSKINLQQHPQWRILSAFIAVAFLGGGVLRILSPQDHSLTKNQRGNQEQVEASSELFDSAVVALLRQSNLAASSKDLLNSTNSQDRLGSVSTGRLDPFAPVTQTSGQPKSSQSVSPPASGSFTPDQGNTGLDFTRPLPTASVSDTADLPPLPPAHWSPTPVPLPSIPVATNPIPVSALPKPVTALSPVQNIEVSGVIQVGNQVGIIVQEAHRETSLHIFAGDYLAGGQVLVKSIDLSAQEPLVILEYQGQDYPKTVGSSGLTGIS